MHSSWFSVFSLLVFCKLGISKDCITPHGDLGICKEITSCQTYYDVLDSWNNVSVQKYLTQSYCGTRYGRDLICCGPKKRNVNEECGSMKNSARRKREEENAGKHFPWMVALQYKDDEEAEPAFRCQGFLVNQQFVLTAAHCLIEKVHGVILGVSNLTDYDKHESYKKAEVVNLYRHDDFESYADDIGLIRIKPVQYTENIGWICLPSKKTPPPDLFTIRGWGMDDDKPGVFSVAKESTVPYVHYENCRKANEHKVPMDKVLCAGGEPFKDSCRGDSGGALMNETADLGWTAFGIVAFGSPNCSIGVPGVYTRIQYYLDWLNTKMIDILKHKD